MFGGLETTMPGPLYWIDVVAQQRGLRYEPDADERWLRAWEPYTTIKTPFRYEHALHATGGNGSISIARAVLEMPSPATTPYAPTEVGTWIAIVQDVRVKTRAAVTSDFGSVFSETLELISLPRIATGDARFDHVFASFAASNEDLSIGITPSVRKLLLSWRVPVHAETRPGGFILAPVTLSADSQGLAWMLDAVVLFGDKATKPRT
jgi:hypothetical protein